jgi:hypothetical protein
MTSATSRAKEDNPISPSTATEESQLENWRLVFG